MMKTIRRIIPKFVISCSLLMIPLVSFGQISLPQLISSGMILQRNARDKIWGWASPGEKITVRFHGKTYHTTTGKDRKWSVLIAPMKAGGPFKMQIEGGNTITLKNILVGDVWMASGQSNMQHTMYSFREIYENVMEHAHNNDIRYFDVPQQYNFDAPQPKLPSGKWVMTNPQTIKNFSAVAYFFAKELYQKKHIPIGIINASVGGSPAQAWISANALKNEFPNFYQTALQYRDSILVHYIRQHDQKRIHAWHRQLQKKDRGYSNSKKPWTSPDISTSDWLTMQIPGYWSITRLGPENGVVWFRKKVNVPADMVGKAAKLRLGRIVNADSTFINGKFVGTTSYMYPQRLYKVPAGVLKKGGNTIVIRVINTRGEGGFVADKPYRISTVSDTLNLKGAWKFRLGAAMRPLKPQTFVRWQPTGLYNAMIAPVQNFRIRGVIWYQGASNAAHPQGYRKLFELLIKSWRKQWQEGTFPFLYVQLPNFMKESFNPNEPSGWAQIREAQLKALALPKTGMAITIDLGEWNDVHPFDKKDVGKRLALVAQKVAYGEDNIIFSGPLYQSMNIKDHSIVVTFARVGKGLTTNNGKSPQEFIIAGKDGHFVRAQAKIIAHNKVKVWSKKIANPAEVRYAWANNPAHANLYNSAGLPASPFKVK
jgi:sialate O-acetylesterase